LRKKAPRSSRRCCLSRGGIRGGSWPGRACARFPDLANNRVGDPGARSATRRACATSFAKRAIAFTRALRPAICLVQTRGSQGARCGNASRGQRSRHRLVPAHGGARAPLACEDRRLAGCARASYSGCRSRQASPRLKRSAYPIATGRVNGSMADGGSKGPTSVKRASTICLAVAKPRGRPRPEPGVRKGVAGRGSLPARKASRAAFPTRTASRGRAAAVLATPP